MDQGKLQPVLLGGLFIGVMSALPIISAGNCCCCMWVIGGGVLTVYLRQQQAPVSVTAAEGALLGLMAGLVGGIIGAILSIPVQMLMGPMQAEWVNRILQSNQDMPPEAREMAQRMMAGSTMRVAGMLINVCVSVVFGLVGGLLGVAIFKKNTPPPMPPMAGPPMGGPPPPPPEVTTIPYDPGVAR